LKIAAPPAYISRVPAKEPKRDFKVGDKIRVNLHHGKIEDAVVKAVVQDDDGIKLQVDVVGLDLTALIDTRQVVE
jgi:transcription antitermination factor NusG